MDIQYLAYVANSARTAVWQFLLQNLLNSTQPVFVIDTTCSTTQWDWSVQ